MGLRYFSFFGTYRRPYKNTPPELTVTQAEDKAWRVKRPERVVVDWIDDRTRRREQVLSKSSGRYNPTITGGNRMRTFLWSAVFLLISSCLVAQDDWHGDGNSLLTRCSLAVRIFDGEKLSSTDAVDGGFCVGYILGIHDTDFMVEKLEEHEKITLMKHACPPSNASTAQVVRVVVKYLRDNPERLHMFASVLVTDAIRNSFPCK